MSSTLNGHRDTVAATAGLGMYAVARHMLDHKLPAPYSIDAPTPWFDPERITISVHDAGLFAWLDSIVVDGETAKPVENPLRTTAYEIVKFDGRLPAAIGDVAVTVKVVRPVAAPAGAVALSVVSA